MTNIVNTVVIDVLWVCIYVPYGKEDVKRGPNHHFRHKIQLSM